MTQEEWLAMSQNANPLVALGSSLAGTFRQSQGLDQAMGELSKIPQAAGQYIEVSKQQGQGYLSPYAQMGVGNITPYLQAAENVGDNMTMTQFRDSPYWQVGQSSMKQQADQLAAQAGAKGVYGTGNSATALQANAMNTMLGAYDNANKTQLQNYKDSANAMFQPLSLGYNAADRMGIIGSEAANTFAGLQKQLMESKAQAATRGAQLDNMAIDAISQYAYRNPSIISGAVDAVKGIWDKLLGGKAISAGEQRVLNEDLSKRGASPLLDATGNPLTLAYDESNGWDYLMQTGATGAPYPASDTANDWTNPMSWYNSNSATGTGMDPLTQNILTYGDYYNDMDMTDMTMDGVTDPNANWWDNLWGWW